MSLLSRVTLLIFLLTFIAFTVSGVQTLNFTPDKGTTFNITSSQVKGCKVCTVAGRSKQCHPSLLVKDNTPVSLEFECSRPQDVFSVEIVRNIECNTKSCNARIVQADSGSLPFLDFNRKFTWNLKASAPKAFKIDFGNTGLRQIDPSERCPDKHSYTLQAFQATGNVAVGKYCKSGPVISAQILNTGSFSLDVPAGQKLQNGQFDVSVGEEIKSLARITLTLPKGTSTSELLSPNYPDSFPDDDVMEWYFQVPDKHRISVQFSKLIQPRCLKKQTAVEYHSKGRGASVLRLSDTQPAQEQGDFALKLRNCEMDRKRAGSPGLALSLKVSSTFTGLPVTCEVDLSKIEGLSLHIEKLRPTSDCKMKMGSVLKETITVTSKSVLTFQDCFPEDVKVTATRVLECRQQKDCPKTSTRLSVPTLPTCLPVPLSNVTWTLRPSQHGTVELTSPTGPLKQCLPGNRCNDSIIIKVAEDDGTTVGHFCPQGAIQKIQIHTNVSVTLSGTGGKALTTSKYVLNAMFKEEISERYIFTISPKKDTPVLLATPGWPIGMKSYSTVSWIVSVPPKMEAHLMFANLSQPKCSNRHTNIRVQRVGSPEEEYSRREDEEAESEITVSDNFYLNMSNCMPEREGGHFSVITKITLQKSIMTCEVDLSKMEGLSLHIEKLRPTSDCKMKMGSVLKETITVTSKSVLTFQDCFPEDVKVTATRVLECRQQKDCPKTSTRLSVPTLPTCLPVPLSNVTWTLRPSQHGTVELTSPTGPLKQCLPGNRCNDSIIIKVAEDDGTTVGHFCPQGAIQKIQIHTSVSVTLSGTGGKALTTSKYVLNAMFKEEISERYIFTISPKKDTPVLLATPGWPIGMKSYSTVSWIVSVPPKMEAHLMFANLSQPKCSNRHTNIRVQRVGFPEEEYSRREDEEAESEITVSDNFYLNMSNCMPEREGGHFSVITKITLQKSINLLLTIILSVVAVLLVIFVIVLVVVCVVIRKKKKELNPEVSIYNPNGTNFLPGYNGFPKTDEDVYHVYDSIEDMLVYTHLLRKGEEMGVYGEFDSHQPVTGHKDSQKPLISRNPDEDDMAVGSYQQFQAPPLPIRPPSHVQSMVDNAIYQTEDQNEEEDSPNLGPRLEPEGGN